MFELLDVYERLEIALKLKRGRLQKAKVGGYAGGGAPFGYECLRGSKKLYVNTIEANAVQRVFEIRQGFPDMTLKNITEFMKAEGYKGRKGADFNPMLVKRILDKEYFYRGCYKYGDIESVGEYEPILV